MTRKINTIIILLILTTIFLSQTAFAWDDCPFGFEDEEYPGTCWRYVDTNNDGICDRSQSEPTTEEENQEATSSVSNSYIENEKTLLDNENFVKLIMSFIITIIGIIVLRFLRKKQIISNIKEKIIWNILLLIFFLPSAITGLILVLMPTFEFLREISVNFIDLHSVTSYFFMWISAYHIIWHTKYYTKALKNIKN